MRGSLGGLPLRAALKRGALITAANWPVVFIQFMMVSVHRLAMAVPVVGGIFVVAVLAGADVRALLAADLRAAIGLVATALPWVAATSGEALSVQGRPAPSDLASVATRRLPAARMLDVAESLGAELPAQQVFLVPLARADGWLGCLVLLDPNGESPDDRLLEAYASRAARPGGTPRPTTPAPEPRT